MQGTSREAKSMGETDESQDGLEEPTAREFYQAIQGLTAALNRVADAYSADDITGEEVQPQIDMSGRPIVR